MTSQQSSKPKLIVRNAKLKDVAAIRELCRKIYLDTAPYTVAQLRGQIQNFPAGQFVAVYEDQVVGYCATFMIDEAVALKPHSWAEITGNGYGSRHDDAGDWLYGMEVFVDNEYRGLRIGQRLYNARKQLSQFHRLKGIVFGGRMPGLARRANQSLSPHEYADRVAAKELRDPVLSFQLGAGFELIGVIDNYLPGDRESRGAAAHLVWRNPKYDLGQTERQVRQRGRMPDTVRLATVQYAQRRVESFDEFRRYIEYFVDVTADYRADFVTFPEMITLQLLSMEKQTLTPLESIKALTRHTDALVNMLSELAVSYNINIIGGSHPTLTETGQVQNICYVCLRDGSVHARPKIHPTPNERYWWNIVGGDSNDSIQTDCGPIGVMICYDSEFPELTRHLVDQGARILFVPFCTDERQSYLRVRYCCQARAVENQCYVVMSGNVGNLPGVENMDIQYAQSCILTPSDFMFSRDGIAADTTPNVEMVATADLSMAELVHGRNSGTVQNLKDRRFDLYALNWTGQ